jgi:hypothetical protein
MYLEGRKFHWTSWDKPAQDRTEDGYPVGQVELRLGQWRKHPDLHGYIVNTFASGEDNCQDINLDAVGLRAIVKAMRARTLPHTEGFFFGSSDGRMMDPEQVEADCKVFEAAIAWLEGGDPGTNAEGRQAVSREVIYRASW